MVIKVVTDKRLRLDLFARRIMGRLGACGGVDQQVAARVIHKLFLAQHRGAFAQFPAAHLVQARVGLRQGLDQATPQIEAAQRLPAEVVVLQSHIDLLANRSVMGVDGVVQAGVVIGEARYRAAQYRADQAPGQVVGMCLGVAKYVRVAEQAPLQAIHVSHLMTHAVFDTHLCLQLAGAEIGPGQLMSRFAALEQPSVMRVEVVACGDTGTGDTAGDRLVTQMG